MFELEAFAMFTSVDRWSRYIPRALHKKDHWPVNKIAMLTDSTTAAAKKLNLQLPEYDIKHLCSKGRRLLSWADKIAYSASWPMVTAHVQGELNCLAHMLSHIGDILSIMGKGETFCTFGTTMMHKLQHNWLLNKNQKALPAVWRNP